MATGKWDRVSSSVPILSIPTTATAPSVHWYCSIPNRQKVFGYGRRFDDITLVPEARCAPCAADLQKFLERPLESLEIGALLRRCVHGLCAGAPPSRRLDERVTKVLAAIRQSDDLRMSIEDAAAMAFLSPSRFAHLFKQQVGLPFRRYMLWRKLTRALVVIGRERTISTAAHEADFADAAHLTRTFYQMFGMPPSVMMRGKFFEIPSPFDAPSAPQTIR